MFRQNSGATTVKQTGGLSQDAKLCAQAELANQTGETDSEEEGDDEGDDDDDGI